MFSKAKRINRKLRMALVGPSGSGKTYTALRIAAGFGGKVALIDTERSSASMYADAFDFDVAELESFSPRMYVEAIKAAEAAGYEVLIIDSLTHAWAGKGGILEMLDRKKAQNQGGNQFTSWAELTPLHNQLVDAILSANLHVIATMRAKTEYAIELDSRGKSVPRKVGTAPVQRDNVEYEFDVVGELNHAHSLNISKSRIEEFQDVLIHTPTEDFGQQLRRWYEAQPVVELPKQPNLVAQAKQLGLTQGITPKDPSTGIGEGQKVRLARAFDDCHVVVDGKRQPMQQAHRYLVYGQLLGREIVDSTEITQAEFKPLLNRLEPLMSEYRIEEPMTAEQFAAWLKVRVARVA